MKPLPHPSSSSILLFSILLLMISINTIPTCICEDDSQYTNCNSAFSCESSISDLKYPFWGGNRDSYCGVTPDPNMELTCEGGVPKITINEVKYRILGWDNTTQKLTVTRDDYGGGDICAVTGNYKNSTFGNTQFQRDGGTGILNVTLLYNCVTDGNLASRIYSTSCDDGRVVVYTVAVDTSAVLCNPSAIVVIPISGAQASSIASSNRLNDALKEGFELKWSGNNEECGWCVDSDGVCGNDDEGAFTCFCKDGPYTTRCNSEKAPASTSSSKQKWRLIVIGASVAGFGVTIFFIIMISCNLKKIIGVQKRIFRTRRKFVDHNIEVFMKSYNLLAPKRYNYAEVKRITSSFRDKLGQGGYGIVYKASLPDGRQVAVKVISESKGNGEEFINEVASISRTSHEHCLTIGFLLRGKQKSTNI